MKNIKRTTQELPRWSACEDSALPTQGQSTLRPVGEPRCHMPRSAGKKKKERTTQGGHSNTVGYKSNILAVLIPS